MSRTPSLEDSTFFDSVRVQVDIIEALMAGQLSAIESTGALLPGSGPEVSRRIDACILALKEALHDYEKGWAREVRTRSSQSYGVVQRGDFSSDAGPWPD